MANIREYLDHIREKNQDSDIIDKMCYKGFSPEIKEQLEGDGFVPYQGKVRELVRSGEDLWIYHTDRLTAFDRYIGLVPFKGAILARLSEFWLKEASQLMPVHFKCLPHGRVICGEAMEPVKVEVIVRGYMAGSMARAYSKGVRQICGVSLPEGLEEFRPLPSPIITPTTKAEAFEHDEDITAEELVAKGVCTDSEWKQISKMALELFAHGEKIYGKKGWLLADTKYEFGRSRDGAIKVIDEIHTPDSSRLWRASSYEERLSNGEAPEMLDKEVVRRYLLSKGFSGEGDVPVVPNDVLVELAGVYLEVAECLLDGAIELDLTTPLPMPQH